MIRGAMAKREKFGEFVRQQRQAQDIGLRAMAKKIGVSPTYLSKVERDEFPPPAEDKIKAIAQVLGCNADDLLARADKVATDIVEIIRNKIKEDPVQFGDFYRSSAGASVAIIGQWTDMIKKGKAKK
jgi:transcriptional regulator with XRE-family HTH domain